VIAFTRFPCIHGLDARLDIEESWKDRVKGGTVMVDGFPPSGNHFDLVSWCAVFAQQVQPGLRIVMRVNINDGTGQRRPPSNFNAGNKLMRCLAG
jgi:hypothetical protein